MSDQEIMADRHLTGAYEPAVGCVIRTLDILARHCWCVERTLHN